MPDTRPQAVTINFANQPGFAVNYLYSAFSTGINALSASIAFFLVNLYNVSQGHFKAPFN
jgi:hypothetical protein